MSSYQEEIDRIMAEVQRIADTPPPKRWPTTSDRESISTARARLRRAKGES